MTSTGAAVNDPTCTIPYPIPHDGTGYLHVYEYQTSTGIGNSKNNVPAKTPPSRLILYCGGYPDDYRSFIPLAKRLVQTSSPFHSNSGDTDDAARGNCAVAIMCLPGHERAIGSVAPESNVPYAPNKDGYSFADWTACVREATRTLRKHYSSSSAAGAERIPLTCICHDWGMMAGITHINQSIESDPINASGLTPDDVVLFDVMPGLHPKVEQNFLETVTSIKAKRSTTQDNEAFVEALYKHEGVPVLFSLRVYHVAIAIIFGVYRYISSWISYAIQDIIVIFLIVARTLPIDAPGPGGDIKHALELNLAFADKSYRCYPYWNLCCDSFHSRFDQTYVHAPIDMERTPLLFIYGAAKMKSLHDRHSVAYLEYQSQLSKGKKTPSTRVVRLEGAGHNIQTRRVDECFREIVHFLGLEEM
mmetsp:Transcript_1993/g.5525  ORF Transcript_1993/g.5525 Transcript_1993/m.5525 type:complete len:418 (-) Transcript_1993:158-1411(-)|eukprot:CAMPEP_0198120050 /NCGR_PEP_ID=MMETSP1442-20131203/27823_1 /TAXON_ID= /ORGANISM="Craspedostauros australis, Strain CCMP3328" /LENGTH=417 /DNA_ID=CAMNT_0043778635 /DNA_START=16 /DNA_END=1269 /DNA_ORIENTATION=+